MGVRTVPSPGVKLGNLSLELTNVSREKNYVIKMGRLLVNEHFQQKWIRVLET